MSERARVPAIPTARRSHGDAASGPRRAELHRHSELLEAKIAAQTAEIKKLVGDNQRLASTHAVLREELAAARQEAERVRARIRSVQVESDIQIGPLVERTARAEAIIRAGEGVRSGVQLAIKEAQGLVAARQELNARILELARELQKARDDIKSLPHLRSELDSLKMEHQRLRCTFEYEKSLNMDLVEQLKAMEQKLISMAKELEQLQVENIANVQKAYPGSYLNPHIPVNQLDSQEKTGRAGPTSVVDTSTGTANPGSERASASMSDGEDPVDDDV